MSFGIDSVKTSQISYELIRREGGKMHLLKLMKLLYILDREAITRRGVPVIGGSYYSMRHGPVIGEVLDLINVGDGGIWSASISDRSDHMVGLGDSDPGLKRVSPMEFELLDEVWEKFGHMDRWELREWTHRNIPEYEERESGRSPIPIERMGAKIGLTAKTIQGVSDLAKTSRMLDGIFA